MLVAKGVGMSVENVGEDGARIITMSPDPQVVREEIELGEVEDGSPGGNVFDKGGVRGF